MNRPGSEHYFFSSTLTRIAKAVTNLQSMVIRTTTESYFGSLGIKHHLLTPAGP